MKYVVVRLTAAAVALSLGGFSSFAEAQSQSGGLPAMAERLSRFEGITATLESTVTGLVTQVSGLQAANADLRNALNAERASSANLQKALEGEIAARIAADTALRKQLEGSDLFIAIDQFIRDLAENVTPLEDDGQLTNVDLQNVLQQQQQMLQLLSNISKMLHDVTMAVIRNLGG